MRYRCQLFVGFWFRFWVAGLDVGFTFRAAVDVGFTFRASLSAVRGFGQEGV